jgi:Kdo2-lipid IVA lauroyltransferase/acyltransferase
VLAEQALAACAKRAYTGAMRTVRKIRYRLEWLGLKFATKFLPLLSRKACYRLALLLGSLGATFDRRGRRVALSNLRVAFGDEVSTERRAQIVRESYQHFSRTMLDFFWSPRLTSQNFSRYVEFENRERWDEENTRPGKPVIVGCYHYSNFEWLSIVSAFAGFEGVVIAQQFKNPLLDPIFLKLRQRSGHRVAPREGAVMHLYRALRRGERFALLVDLTISAKLPTVAIKCFGLERCVTFAHVWLHQRTGAPLINVHCEPLPGGRYRVVFHPRIEFPAGASLQEIAQACWDQFEPVVRKNPAPWLWMYKHFRYRPLAANLAAYPFYANVSEDFERRLDEGVRKLSPMTSKVKLPMVKPA